MSNTTHIRIREFAEPDILLKIKWINDSDNNRYLHYDLPLEFEKTRQWFHSKNNTIRLDCVIEFENIPVGLIGLVAIDHENLKAEYYISMGEPAYKGRGIATEATRQLLEIAFLKLNLNKVYLNVDLENSPACRLYEKSGFKCEGVFREDLMHNGRLIDRKRYAILKEDYVLRTNRDNQINVLILSSGTRNKIVQYFKNAFAGVGNIVSTDMSNIAPAIYEADAHYIVPSMQSPEYLDVILDICRKERVSGVLSLIDPELSLLARNEARFNEIGTRIIGSSYELCEMSLDKMQMYSWLVEHGYKCARSWMNKDEFFEAVRLGEVDYPVFVKPYRGSASISISKVYDRETVELLFAHESDLMIQEFLNGQEIGADVYIDMISGEVVSIFTKKKLKMRAGETDKAVSFKDEKLFELIEKFVLEAGYRGQIDIDIFDIGGEYYISEVNPRFGGGYPHAYEAGCDHMSLILNNMRGNANEKCIGQYDEGVYMMKYNEVRVLKLNETDK